MGSWRVSGLWQCGTPDNKRWPPPFAIAHFGGSRRLKGAATATLDVTRQVSHRR